MVALQEIPKSMIPKSMKMLDPLAMKKEDLKTALKQRKMDTKGKKKELVKRLTEVLLKEKLLKEKKGHQNGHNREMPEFNQFVLKF